MDRLFVVPTAQEWQTTQNDPMPLPEHTVLPFTDAQGRHNGLLICGIGPVNAALAMGLALKDIQHIGLVVHMGLAGSFDLAAAPLGSHWYIEQEIYAEYGLATDDKVDAHALGFPQWTDATKKHLPVWERLCMKTDYNTAVKNIFGTQTTNMLMGQAHSLTVAGVTNSTTRAQRLHNRYKENGPLLENMEGFSVALACVRHDIPFIELRTVSNLVGSRHKEHRAFDTALHAMGSLINSLLS